MSWNIAYDVVSSLMCWTAIILMVVLCLIWRYEDFRKAQAEHDEREAKIAAEMDALEADMKAARRRRY